MHINVQKYCVEYLSKLLPMRYASIHLPKNYGLGDIKELFDLPPFLKGICINIIHYSKRAICYQRANINAIYNNAPV